MKREVEGWCSCAYVYGSSAIQHFVLSPLSGAEEPMNMLLYSNVCDWRLVSMWKKHFSRIIMQHRKMLCSYGEYFGHTFALWIVQWRQLFSWSKSRVNSNVPRYAEGKTTRTERLLSVRGTNSQTQTLSIAQSHFCSRWTLKNITPPYMNWSVSFDYCLGLSRN